MGRKHSEVLECDGQLDTKDQGAVQHLNNVNVLSGLVHSVIGLRVHTYMKYIKKLLHCNVPLMRAITMRYRDR